MRVRSSRGIAIAQAAPGLLLCILFFTSADVCRAQQSQLPADSMEMTAASHATTWTEGRGSVVELHGPIDIKLDHARLTADNAVVWLSRLPGGLLDEQRVEIALMGHARAMVGWLLGIVVFTVVTALAGHELFLRVEIGSIAGAGAAAGLMAFWLVRQLRAGIPRESLAALVEQIEHEPLEI